MGHRTHVGIIMASEYSEIYTTPMQAVLNTATVTVLRSQFTTMSGGKIGRIGAIRR